MTEPKKGRPRKGSLVWTKSGWCARVTLTVDGERIKQWYRLETQSKTVARRKLARLLAQTDGDGNEGEGGPPTPEQAAAEETFREAAERVVGQAGKDGLKTHQERLSRLRRYAFESMGHLPITEVRAAHVREVLTEAAETLSKQSVIHLRNDMSSVLGDLWRDELISENPVQRVKVPKHAKVDRRPRQQLSDDEFARFAATAGVPEQLFLMALSSRCFGGLRTSDLHAWDWKHFDLDTWGSAEVYRPKTEGLSETTVLERLAIPPVLKNPLHAWWTRQDPPKPKTGPVFPIMKGKNKGQAQGKRSHARDLRLWLWRAGIHRPLDGFEEAMTDLEKAEQHLAEVQANPQGREAYRAALRALKAAKEKAQALDELQTGSDRYQPVDFHSFRRQYSTALAAANVNAQQAMSLAGHKNPSTHARYVQLAQRGILETPAEALPKLPPFWTTPVAKSEVRQAAGGEEFSGFDAGSAGDPNEIRTRVTGVRGRCPNH